MSDMNLAPVGQLDLINDEGWVVGWAWYPQAPERRVAVEVLADGEVIGGGIADIRREDVAAAGFGDGCYGFSIALPYRVLSHPRPVIISVRDQASGAALPKPVVFSQPALQDANASLQLLDKDVRLLAAELARRQAQEAADASATAALFSTVADFFSQLADATLAGASPRSLRTLRHAVQETTTAYQPLDFMPAPQSALSLCFMAGGEMAEMYGSLAALVPDFAKARAELLILDAHDGSDAPLLPLLAANARYMRQPADRPAVGFNRLAGAAHGEILCFVSAPAKLSQPWAALLATSFAEAAVGVLAPRVMSGDGVVEHAGAMLKAGELSVRDARVGEDLMSAALVDAAGPWVFMVRRACWERLGGFDETFETVPGMLAGFCQRVRATGWKVLYQPALEVTLPAMPPLDADELAKASADAARLGELPRAVSEG